MTDDELMQSWMAAPEEHPGNDDRYDVRHVAADPTSPLRGKTIIFLGSSVTVGACSLEQSFVEFLAARDGIVPVKEAVSGTTLALREGKGDSYVERLRTIDPTLQADAFVCQLSTNDATKGCPIGSLGDAPYDTTTTAGAIQDVAAYARKTWGCPVLFYSGTPFELGVSGALPAPLQEGADAYRALVDLLDKASARMGFGVIDLFHDAGLNAVARDDYALYMHDPIHPTKAGYQLWWTPVIRARLIEALA